MRIAEHYKEHEALGFPTSESNPAGADTQIQFNDNGVFAGEDKLTWDKTNKKIAFPAGEVSKAINFDIVDDVSIANADLSLMAGGTNLGIGTYKYTIRAKTIYGLTGTINSGGGTASITTDASNRHVKIKLPIPNNDKITGWRIYRTKVNSSYPIYFCGDVNSLSATEFIDDASDTTIAASITPANYYGMPNFTTGGLSYDGSPVLNIDNTQGSLAIGKNSGNVVNQVGGANISIGLYSLNAITTGQSNISLGVSALRNTQTGSYNIGIGPTVGYWNTTGQYNTALGFSSLYYNSTGSNNTAIGAQAGYSANGINISNSIFFGFKAGRYETASNKLIIDALDRSNEAASRNAAPIYGVLNATVASQVVALNGTIGVNTITPAGALDVHGFGTTTGITFQTTDNAGNVKFAILDNGNVSVGNTSAPVLFSTGAITTALSGGLATDGVGLSFDSLVTIGLGIENRRVSGSGNGCGIALYSNDGAAMAINDRLGYILMGGSSSSNALRQTAGFFAYASENWISGLAYGTRFAIETTSNGSTARTAKLTIDGVGNVGIGTATPKSKLDVVGLPIYANNAAALAGGLVAGSFYQDGGDPSHVCVAY